MAENEAGSEIICANPDCRIAETGKCVEGLETGKCPHYGHVPAEASSDARDAPGASGVSGIKLPAANTLTASDAARFLRAGNARVIAIIGPSDSGKTSLIASLYDLFQEGPVALVEYARSVTLHAFEHTCHDARAASRRKVPHANRTPRGEVRFYHLDVAGGPAGAGLSLVLADRAGEEYRSAADDAAVTASLPEARRADTLTVLVDGERLLDAGARHNLRSEIVMILQALKDGGALQTGQRLALVLTKLDLVQDSPVCTRALADFAGLCDNINQLFGSAFSEIQSFRIAASPKTDTVPRGTGVADLFAFWLPPAVPEATKVPTRQAPSRSFARVRPLSERERDA